MNNYRYSDTIYQVGYRVDDSYFSFAQDFVSGAISLQKLSEAMRLGKLGEQIVLKSPKAFEQKSRRDAADVNELFILDIMREEMKNGDARLSV